MNVSLIVNPIAGNRAYRSIDKIERLLKQRASLTPFITEKKGDAFQFAKSLSGVDRIITVGGDGTLNEVINGVLSPENTDPANVPLALIPLGTTNVLAKELLIPEDIEKAVELALTGTARNICLGRINGRYFASMAGIGFDAEAVLGVKNNLIKKISGKAAHVVSGFKVLTQYGPPLINIKTPENEFTGYTVVAGNAKNYGGQFSITPHASIIEPLLEVCIFKGKTRKDLLRFIIGVISGRHLKFKDVLCQKTSGLELTSGGEVHIQIDGDYFGTLPAKIDVVKDALNFVW
ncbi:MAG: diacylglycerol kinase family lipid kinase [Nitrospirae bacterium]|nr:diacylglycerol kinase family lipid kinase [Nitrospirota bacterium]